MTGAKGNSLPPEVAAIFKKLDRLLENDAAQNETLHPLIRDRVVNGLDCDQLPNATGDFGRSPSNPIPTNGTLGEVMYLSRLRTSSASPVMFHRTGSTDNAVDVYEVLSLDGKTHETLYLSLYHPRKSRKVPRGYSYATDLDASNFTYGVNHIVHDFPAKLDAHVRNWHKDHLGIPLPVAKLREALNGSRFQPSFLDDDKQPVATTASSTINDDILALVKASQDPKNKGKSLAVGLDGVIRPVAPNVRASGAKSSLDAPKDIQRKSPVRGAGGRVIGNHPEDGNPITAQLDDRGHPIITHNNFSVALGSLQELHSIGLNQAVSLLVSGKTVQQKSGSSLHPQLDREPDLTTAPIRVPIDQQRPASTASRGLYRFSFWATLLGCIWAIPLSIIAIFVAQKIVGAWAWLNSPDFMNLISWQYWVFGLEYSHSFLSQMLADSLVSFFQQFVCISAGLLFTFWCLIQARRRWKWRISISSCVMILCIGYMLFGLGSLAFNSFYAWRVYELGTLGCELFSAEFYKCNFVLLDIPSISASFSNLTAAIFAGQVFSRRLDDTDAWVAEVGEKVSDKVKSLTLGIGGKS